MSIVQGDGVKTGLITLRPSRDDLESSSGVGEERSFRFPRPFQAVETVLHVRKGSQFLLLTRAMNAADEPTYFLPTRIVGTLEHRNSVGWHESPMSCGLRHLPARQLYF